VLELAVPQYFEAFLTNLADKIHSLPGDKRVVVVIPPYLPGYPSAEVPSEYEFTNESHYSIRMSMSTSSV
jgi:hypothetical protein